MAVAVSLMIWYFQTLLPFPSLLIIVSAGVFPSQTAPTERGICSRDTGLILPRSG